MGSPEPRAVFEAWVRAMNSGDTDALGPLVHREFTETYPQSGELIRGLDNLRAEMKGHPGGTRAGAWIESSEVRTAGS